MTTKATKQTAAVTTIDQLKAAMEPELVELPGFVPGTSITFRLRRASLRVMLKTGRVPNPLLAAARSMYEGTPNSKVPVEESIKTMELVAASAMVEPTMEQITDAGIELTEEQLGLIFAYSQKGISALNAFRAKSGNLKPGTDGQGVAYPPQ